MLPHAIPPVMVVSLQTWILYIPKHSYQQAKRRRWQPAFLLDSLLLSGTILRAPDLGEVGKWFHKFNR
jgi:hypothetical protein